MHLFYYQQGLFAEEVRNKSGFSTLLTVDIRFPSEDF